MTPLFLCNKLLSLSSDSVSYPFVKLNITQTLVLNGVTFAFECQIFVIAFKKN